MIEIICLASDRNNMPMLLAIEMLCLARGGTGGVVRIYELGRKT